jgi:DNA polymerase I-like protein with 3'-5' exonuclease and polymerase domains
MECERQAINAPVQGFIGDYKAMAMVEIHEKLDRTKVKIVGEHHDAILFIIRDEAIDEIAPQILAILRHPRLLDVFRVDLSVPMEGELEIGPWGAGKSYKEKVISKS